ncbi:MAG: MBL fold metallo-hydrolase [Pontiellaceae bacterium]|nr:MBL fold metallo-hydrolase [Pontiellaceae bacterium]
MIQFDFDPYFLLAVPVLRDNFVYLICREGRAVLIDAGEARPVLNALEQENLQLTEIFITHTHHDHVDGCRELCERLGVLATSPAVEAREYDVLGTRGCSIFTPGHMAAHKIYSFPELGILFTGDTLINGACGRLLGGTAKQLFESLQVIKSFPDETLILGGHDYLEENMRFALAEEPENADMQARLALYQRDPAAAVFATLAEEKRTNPFLRVDSLEAFTALRARKDIF